MRGLHGHTGVLEYNIYIYTCPLFRARRATRTFVNLYLFSRIVSQVLLIRHRSHFFAGTAFRGLRRAPAATTHPSQRGAFIFNINRGFSNTDRFIAAGIYAIIISIVVNRSKIFDYPYAILLMVLLDTRCASVGVY